MGDQSAGAWAGDMDTIGPGNPDPHGDVAEHPYGLSGPLGAYAAGVLVADRGDSALEADAYPTPLHPAAIPVDVLGFRPMRDAPHESTHRRFDAPFTVSISQTAAGFTLVQAPRPGLHFLKVLAAVITVDAAGTVQLVQGSESGVAGTNSPLTGAIPVALNSGFVLPPAPVETPWLFTSPGLALGLISVTGKAFGFLTLCFSPYDS